MYTGRDPTDLGIPEWSGQDTNTPTATVAAPEPRRPVATSEQRAAARRLAGYARSDKVERLAVECPRCFAHRGWCKARRRGALVAVPGFLHEERTPS